MSILKKFPLSNSVMKNQNFILQENKQKQKKTKRCTHKAFVEMGLDDIVFKPIKVVLDPANGSDMWRASRSSECVLSRQRESRE